MDIFFFLSEVLNQPLSKRDQESVRIISRLEFSVMKGLLQETQIVDAALGVPASAFTPEGQGKAAQNPSSSVIPNPQTMTNMVPGPIKGKTFTKISPF